MARLRIHPHREADRDSIQFGGWWIEREGFQTPLPEEIEGWDYASTETVGIGAQVDVSSFLDSTGLESMSQVAMVLMADCKATSDRIIAVHPLSETNSGWTDFGLVLPPGRLADRVAFTAEVVLTQPQPTRSPRVAGLKGSRLIASKSRTMILEGTGSRFPIEPMPFSGYGYPAHAPWSLYAGFADLGDSFMATVRFLVNTDHEIGRMLLDPTTVKRVAGLARADTLRLLVAEVVGRQLELDEDDWDEGSVGRVLDEMCGFYLGAGLKKSCIMYRSDPIQFDATLQDSVRPLEEAFR